MYEDYTVRFEKERYVVIRNFFDTKDVQRMSKRMWYLKYNNLLTQDDQCPGSFSVYADPIQSEMQELYRRKLEDCIGYKLFPTYTYSRIYSPREILHRHSDRPSCEISITTTLDFDTFDNEPWDIYICRTKENLEPEQPYKLYPGDILVYRGCELDHWRDAFVGISQTQAFLHYVDANGPYAECKYDFRPSLGSTVQTKNYAMKKDFDERLDSK